MYLSGSSRPAEQPESQRWKRCATPKSVAPRRSPPGRSPRRLFP